jgi:hypothetical protein
MFILTKPPRDLEIKFGTNIEKLPLVSTEQGQIVIHKHICKKNEEKRFKLKVEDPPLVEMRM